MSRNDRSEAMAAAVRLLELVRAVQFFMENEDAADVLPGTAAAMMAIAEDMAGGIVDELDAMETAA